MKALERMMPLSKYMSYPDYRSVKILYVYSTWPKRSQYTLKNKAEFGKKFEYSTAKRK